MKTAIAGINYDEKHSGDTIWYRMQIAIGYSAFSLARHNNFIEQNVPKIISDLLYKDCNIKSEVSITTDIEYYSLLLICTVRVRLASAADVIQVVLDGTNGDIAKKIYDILKWSVERQ
jgi:hypothetical protein